MTRPPLARPWTTARRNPRRRAALVLGAVGAAAVALLTACGSGGGDTAATATTSSSTAGGTESGATSPGTGGGSAEAEQITATLADFTVSLDEDSLPAGTYEIRVVNDGSSTHDLVVERDGKNVAATDFIQPGDSGTLTVTLDPGDYVFYCSVGNHRAMGMELDVTVT